MSAANISSQTTTLLKLDSGLCINPAYITLIMPIRRRSPHRTPEGTFFHADLLIETAGRHNYTLHLTDFAGAMALRDALLTKINGSRLKPGFHSKFIEISNANGAVIYPPCITVINVVDRIVSVGGRNVKKAQLQIETWGRSQIEALFDNPVTATRMQETLFVLANGKPRKTRSTDFTGMPMPGDANYVHPEDRQRA